MQLKLCFCLFLFFCLCGLGRVKCFPNHLSLVCKKGNIKCHHKGIKSRKIDLLVALWGFEIAHRKSLVLGTHEVLQTAVMFSLSLPFSFSFISYFILRADFSYISLQRNTPVSSLSQMSFRFWIYHSKSFIMIFYSVIPETHQALVLLNYTGHQWTI